MPFTTSMTFSQGADCSQFVINDTSSYTIEATSLFTSRKLTIQKSDGTYLKIGTITYNQYVWPFAAGNNITLTGADTDYAYTVTILHTPTSPINGSIYTKIEKPVFTCFTMSAFFANTGKMAANLGLEKDYKFIKDIMRLYLEQESAKKAGIDGDIGAAQACLDRAKYISDSLKIGY